MLWVFLFPLHCLHGATSTVRRLIMKTKFVHHGLIGRHANLCQNQRMFKRKLFL